MHAMEIFFNWKKYAAQSPLRVQILAACLERFENGLKYKYKNNVFNSTIKFLTQ